MTHLNQLHSLNEDHEMQLRALKASKWTFDLRLYCFQKVKNKLPHTFRLARNKNISHIASLATEELAKPDTQ